MKTSLQKLCFCFVIFFSAGGSASAADDVVTNSDIKLEIQYQAVATSTYEMQLFAVTSDTLLNVYEATLRFNPSLQQVTAISIDSALCEERFIIAKSINNETGEVYVACGTITPFGFRNTPESLLRVSYTVTSDQFIPLTLGSKTTFHKHDGQGTEATFSLTNNPEDNLY